jgi:hypothetical protein
MLSKVTWFSLFFCLSPLFLFFSPLFLFMNLPHWMHVLHEPLKMSEHAEVHSNLNRLHQRGDLFSSWKIAPLLGQRLTQTRWRARPLSLSLSLSAPRAGVAWARGAKWSRGGHLKRKSKTLTLKNPCNNFASATHLFSFVLDYLATLTRPASSLTLQSGWLATLAGQII